MGTLTEIPLAWNKLTMNALSPRPLILLGQSWPLALEALREHLARSDRDMSFLSFAATAEEALAILKEKIG